MFLILMLPDCISKVAFVIILPITNYVPKQMWLGLQKVILYVAIYAQLQLAS